jgi:hypothetical protein
VNARKTTGGESSQRETLAAAALLAYLWAVTGRADALRFRDSNGFAIELVGQQR